MFFVTARPIVGKQHAQIFPASCDSSPDIIRKALDRNWSTILIAAGAWCLQVSHFLYLSRCEQAAELANGFGNLRQSCAAKT
jgi:hypothetical protein